MHEAICNAIARAMMPSVQYRISIIFLTRQKRRTYTNLPNRSQPLIWCFTPQNTSPEPLLSLLTYTHRDRRKQYQFSLSWLAKIKEATVFRTQCI